MKCYMRLLIQRVLSMIGVGDEGKMGIVDEECSVRGHDASGREKRMMGW